MRRTISLFLCTVMILMIGLLPSVAHANGHIHTNDVLFISQNTLMPLYEAHCTGGNGICNAPLRGTSAVILNGTEVFSGFTAQCLNCRTVYAIEFDPRISVRIGRWAFAAYYEMIPLMGLTIIEAREIFYEPTTSISGVRIY